MSQCLICGRVRHFVSHLLMGYLGPTGENHGKSQHRLAARGVLVRDAVRRPAHLIATLACLAALLPPMGCAHVAPWQRENLASKRMRLGADPEAELLEQHVFQYREGSSGGYGGGGGGCGCN